MLTEKVGGEATLPLRQNGKEPDHRGETPALPFSMASRNPSFFGLIDVVKVAESGAGECAERHNYVGPNSRFLITLSIVFGGRRRADGDYDPVYIDGKKCSFDWHRGLTGPGIEASQVAKK